MFAVLALTVFSALPQTDVAYDVVDLVELNHVYDARGNSTYTQVLFYDWRPLRGEYQVRASRLMLSDGRRPERDFARGDWVMIFSDGGTLREVRATAFRESWTQYDVEQAERNRFPKEYRPGLLFERMAFPIPISP